MKRTCTWSPEQVSNCVIFHSFLESRASTEEQTWSAALPVKTKLFIIDLLGNTTIGNYHFGTLGRQKKKKQRSGPNQPPGHREPSRFSHWPVRAWLDNLPPVASWCPPGLWCCSTGVSQRQRRAFPEPSACQLLHACLPLSFSSHIPTGQKHKQTRAFIHLLTLLSLSHTHTYIMAVVGHRFVICCDSFLKLLGQTKRFGGFFNLEPVNKTHL